MTSIRLSQLSSQLFTLALGALLCASCGDSGPTIDVEIPPPCAFNGGRIAECAQPVFPMEQPDMVCGPRFNDIPPGDSARQAQTIPGQDIRTTIFISASTTRAIMELVLDDQNELPEDRTVISMQDIDPGGSTEVDVVFQTPPNDIGRYYMRVTLCAGDCAVNRVEYTLDPTINDPYRRTRFENDAEIETDSTCLNVREVVIRNQG